MAASTEVPHHIDADSVRVPLDESLFKPEDDDVKFLSSQIGIQDPEELKQHILAVQKEAYAVYPYPCIYRFAFASSKISRPPAYQQMLKLGRERPGALFLELGSCVGTDMRRAIADGFPMNQTIASDLQPGFWDIGHKLYKSTPESFPVPFIAGDATNPAFLIPAPIPDTPPTDPLPDLHSLTSLAPLVGRVSVIFTAAFFHLFDEPTQLAIAQCLGALLLPEPGSMIFGLHGASPEKGMIQARFSQGAKSATMFCHSPESWKEMWEGVFGEGKVKVESVLRELPAEFAQHDRPFHFLIWSVTRL